VAGIDGLVSCRALIDYDRTGRALVAGLKFRNCRAPVAELARLMARLVDADTHDLVTWVPTTDARRRRRGYDQARLLAEATARALGSPCAATLAKVSGHHQTGRPRAERLSGIDYEPRVGRARSLLGVRILVVDDVVTTGASLAAAARALRGAGAASVEAVILARTPLKVPADPTDDN
jgi:ComF family protein